MRGAKRNPDHSSLTTWVNGCTRIVAVAECASGNKETGTSWLETKSFASDAPLNDVLDWAHEIGCNGKLILCPDLSTYTS